MKVLIVGSKGMLGQEFIRQLNMITLEHGNIITIEAVGWGREELDITKEAEVARKIGQLKPDVIINCAAYNNVDKAEGEPEKANLINGEAVGYLAAAAADCGAVFVHFSSDYVFDGLKGEYAEDDEPNPISKYGESKLLGEKQLYDNYYLVRTSKLFGPPGSGETSKKSFPEMMLGIARKNGKIEVIDSEVGSPTYVKDLAEATLVLIGFPPLKVRGGVGGVMNDDKLRQSYPSGIYHITNSGSCAWYEYAKAALEYTGVNAEVIPVGSDYFPRKARRPSRVILLNTKLPSLRPWQEALKEFLQNNP